MKTTHSKTKIDRLGDRLREGAPTETDLILLDQYRRSFGKAYEQVVSAIRKQLGLEPTGRPAKSTRSVVEKLRRESIRLSQMQDIAGCRIIVADIAKQEGAIASLRGVVPSMSIVDRRENPSYGYRAVHVIANVSGNLIEIQVRTLLQHGWAELSEKFSDVIDPSIKYGAGADEVRKVLAGTSAAVARIEENERKITTLETKPGEDAQLQTLERMIVEIRDDMLSELRKLIVFLDTLKEEIK